MVRAKYTVEDNTHTLVVLGHANYDEYGKDIVCAGVSSLVQALIGWIEENHYKANCISVDTSSSEVIISCEGGEDIAAVFGMTVVGLEQIADSYPDHVQIDTIGIAD
jgi:uncharacterized protein YsxB (DUF464 family)